MHLASMDIKTAFDVARPKRTAKLMGDQAVHGWITADFLREMAGLAGQATFEHVENHSLFSRCIRQGRVEAPRLWLKIATQILWNVEPEWKRKKMGVHTDTCQRGEHQTCSFMWADIGGSLTQRRSWSR